MPNWCENHLVITGPLNRVAAFVQRVQGTPETWSGPPMPPQAFCFNTLVPIPAAVVAQEVEKTIRHWCNAHWGTQWEPRCATNTPPPIKTLRSGFATVHYLFDTAWSPPLAWLDTVAAHWLLGNRLSAILVKSCGTKEVVLAKLRWTPALTGTGWQSTFPGSSLKMRMRMKRIARITDRLVLSDPPAKGSDPICHLTC